MHDESQIRDAEIEPTESVNTAPPRARLRRSRTDKVIAGVCGGLGYYLDVDPVLVRIAFVALAFAGGSGVLLYIVAWIAMPEAPEGEPDTPVAATSSDTGRMIAGGALVVLGMFFLIRVFVPWFDWEIVWALVLVGLGGAILIRSVQR